MAQDSPETPRRFVNIAVLTVSDTRTLQTDTSGAYLQEALEEEGHTLADRKIVVDDIYQMRAIVTAWLLIQLSTLSLPRVGLDLLVATVHPKRYRPYLIKLLRALASYFVSYPMMRSGHQRYSLAV